MMLKVPPPLQGALTGMAMWLVAQYASFLPFEFALSSYLALGFITGGLIIEAIAITVFWRARTTVSPLAPQKTSQLVTKGLYGISRNPMYAGLALLLFGWGIYLGEGANLLIWLIFLYAVTGLQIKPEEAALREKFGPAYHAYCQRVRRWL